MTADELKVVEACKKALLRQLQPVRGHNGHPYEAVAKTTILGLEHLVEIDLKGLSSNTDTITT